MRIWSFLVVYSCWSDAGKEKQSVNENDTAAKALTKGQVFLKDVLPPEEYKPFEKASKQEEIREKIKVVEIGNSMTVHGPMIQPTQF